MHAQLDPISADFVRELGQFAVIRGVSQEGDEPVVAYGSPGRPGLKTLTVPPNTAIAAQKLCYARRNLGLA